MEAPHEEGVCPKCGDKAARRLKDVEADEGWHYISHTTILLCPRCDDVECFVTGCEKPAETMRNDHCLCDVHAPLIRRYQALAGRGGCVGCLGLLLLPLSFVWGALSFAPFIQGPLAGVGIVTMVTAWVLGRRGRRFLGEHHLAKKADYCSKVGNARDVMF